MDHPQDFVKLAFKDRLYIWWLKLLTYWLLPLSIFYKAKLSSRPKKNIYLSRKDENILFSKIIKVKMKDITRADCARITTSSSSSLRFLSGDNRLTIEFDLYAGEDLWVVRFQHNGQSLFKDSSIDAMPRWWLERWILKSLNKAKRRLNDGNYVDSKVEDVVIDFKTKNL